MGLPPERQYQHNGRPPAAVVVSRDRNGMPGTPSRKEKQRESSAVQDPGLKDYVRRPPVTGLGWKAEQTLRLCVRYC
jgi:hypothetical protein